MAINIDSQLLKAIQDSTCFGIAYDESVPECVQCDVKGQCKAKSEGASIATPMSREVKSTPTRADEPKKTPAKPKEKKTTKAESKPSATKEVKEPKKTPVGMPDFKPMTLEELKALAKERSVEWKDYGNDNITRMRLIMVLKKSY